MLCVKDFIWSFSKGREEKRVLSWNITFGLRLLGIFNLFCLITHWLKKFWLSCLSYWNSVMASSVWCLNYEDAISKCVQPPALAQTKQLGCGQIYLKTWILKRQKSVWRAEQGEGSQSPNPAGHSCQGRAVMVPGTCWRGGGWWIPGIHLEQRKVLALLNTGFDASWSAWQSPHYWSQTGYKDPEECIYGCCPCLWAFFVCFFANI